MKARLESRTPSEVWLVVENDTDADTQLQAVKIIVRWQDPGGTLTKMTRSGPWKPCAMFLGPRMTFRLDVTNLLRQVIEDELPKLPAEKSVESAAELFTGADSAVFCTSLSLKYDGATQSFAPSP
jgi:hypothetical protein